MYKVIMCIIAAIVVMLLILQFAENAALCFTEDEKQQIKAALNKCKLAIKRFINHIHIFMKG